MQLNDRKSVIFMALPRKQQASVLDVVTSATRLIRSGSAWTQFSFARDRNNSSVDARDRRAVFFDAVGALLHCAGQDRGVALDAWRCLEDFADGALLSALNDARDGHETIVRLFSRFLRTYALHTAPAMPAE